MAEPGLPADWTGARLEAEGLDPTVRAPLRRRLRAGALFAATRLGALAPRLALAPGLGLAAGRARAGRLGQRARANLELALGSELDAAAREELLRAVFRHGSRQAAEWLRLARGTQGARGAWLDRAVTVDASVERLERLAAEGRGVLVVTGHLGNWELLAATLRRRGFDGGVVGRVNRLDATSAWLPRLRAGYGVTTLPQDAAPRQLLGVLRGGGVLGLLCDLEVRRLDGEFLPFFGQPALTMTAPAALARAARLPLLPARCVLPPGAGRHTPYSLSFEEPLPPPPRGSGREGLRATLTQLLAVYERWVREVPEQWAWHQHRWRTRPGEFQAVPLAERRRLDIAKLRG